MSYNKKKKILRYIKKFLDKYGLHILIILFILGPLIINFIFRENSVILDFTRSEILDYYGVMISGVITFLVLRVTINNSNEILNKQIETQNKIMNKQFEFELRQKQVRELEEKLENILDSCKISIEAIIAFDKIPNYLSEATINELIEPISKLGELINELFFIAGCLNDKFRLVLSSFIIEDIIFCDEYKKLKLDIIKYINTYLEFLSNLNGSLEEMNKLISSIQDKSQKDPNNNLSYKNVYVIIDEKEKQSFANLKSNIDYYIGAHNAFKIRGWTDLSKGISEFIKFLNKYIMNFSDIDKGKK